MTEREILLTTERFRVEIATRLGADGNEHQRPVIRHPGAVTILPMVDRDHVCLIRNARIAVDRTLIELPAGTLELGEDPIVTARRELAEETGFRAGRLEPLRSFYLSPGILDERMHVFVASELTAGPSACEVGEEIENLIVPWNEALQMVFDGRIEDAKTMVALLLYNQRRA